MGSTGEVYSKAHRKKAGMDQLIQNQIPPPHLERGTQLLQHPQLGLK
jgi:hypothetical protein